MPFYLWSLGAHRFADVRCLEESGYLPAGLFAVNSILTGDNLP